VKSVALKFEQWKLEVYLSLATNYAKKKFGGVSCKKCYFKLLRTLWFVELSGSNDKNDW